MKTENRRRQLYLFVGLLSVITAAAILPGGTWGLWKSFRVGSKYRLAQKEMRQVARVLYAYAVDHCSCHFPPWTLGKSADSIAAGNPLLANMPTFNAPPIVTIDDNRDVPSHWTLTTPMAYLENYPSDPFNPTETFSYYANSCVTPDQDMGWILLSPGPDGDFDIDPLNDYDAALPFIDQKELFLSVTFDPTNGAGSDGDVFLLYNENWLHDQTYFD